MCSDDTDMFDEFEEFHDNLNHLIDHIDAGRNLDIVWTVRRIVVDISVNQPADMSSDSNTRKCSFPLVYPRSRRNWKRNQFVANGRIYMTPFEKAQQAMLESVIIQLYRLRYDAAGKLELLSSYASALREACLEYLISVGKRMASSLPYWDVRSGELTYKGECVLKLSEKGENQRLVLASFQEHNWSCQIDDPLPQDPAMVSMARVQNTVRDLNKSRLKKLIRFGSDGAGTGFTWKPVF